MHSSCVVWPWLDLRVFHYECIKCYLNQECQLGTFPVLVTCDATLRPHSASIELQSVLPWPQALSESVVCASPEKREVRDCCLYDLGVEVSPRPTKANAADMLRDGLGSISSARLKPQQRLYIATHHLLPKCHHQLPLPSSSAKYLRWLDPTVQPALRSWLKLPKDNPIPLFHAPVVEGGLGVPLHEHVVPLMPAKRLSRSDESPDPVIAQDHIRS